jgi:transcriptional regulator with XRE-family HTH domain
MKETFLEYLNNNQSKLLMSQNDFAKHLGFSKVTMSLILNGTRRPSVEFIYDACMKLENNDIKAMEFIRERLKYV